MAQLNVITDERLRQYNQKILAKMAADIAAAVEDAGYDDSDLRADVDANTTAIETLNGTGEGSITEKVSMAVAEIVADADPRYDTLKEIADWIISDTTGAAAMNTQIKTNTDNIFTNATDIDALEETVNSLPTTEYISENYATSAQGALADTALQREEISVVDEEFINGLFSEEEGTV